MTTVADVDRLVLAADGAVAHYWPRLGPKVRNAYLDDRNKWIAIRQAPDAGASVTAEALETQRRVFSGWGRAFKAVGARPRLRKPAAAPSKTAPAVAAPLVAPSATTAPALATVSRGTGGAGTAVAGGLVLAGLIAVAARRRKA
ncbi:MAG TPA: hypothetical protein VHJ20_00970 [Polyangia bacterium]|nr:hypothetical protein [Polyangia bacterium]